VILLPQLPEHWDCRLDHYNTNILVNFSLGTHSEITVY
jgi:hypothetical protein